MNVANGKKDLETIREIFTELKLPLILVYGTALGAYRDKKLIEDDRDIDIGTFGDKELIWTRLEKEGFKKRGERLYLPIERNVNIDLFIFQDVGTVYKSMAYDNQVCAELPKYPLQEIEFYGKTYLIPDPEPYLTYCYGDWKIKSNKHGFPK